MFFKRLASLLVLVLGIAGMAGCLAGAYGVWLVASRLDRANDKVFDAVDRSLKAVQDRIPIVQQKVKESKVTTAELGDAVRDWGAQRVQNRIVSKLQIETRTEKLAGHLRTADLTLEASTEAVHDIRRLLEISRELGVEVDPTSVDGVQERLGSLQESLQQAERAVDAVRKFAQVDPIEERLAQVAKLLARIVLTLSDVDQRLADVADRVAEVRIEAEQAHARTSHYILLGSVACYALLAWIGAGQMALSWWGWRGVRRGRAPTGPDANAPPR